MATWNAKAAEHNRPLPRELDRNALLAFGPGPSLQRASWVFLGLFATGYVMFQKKVLPYKYAKFAARLFFWPTLPLTILNRWSNYWTAIDAPLAPLGHIESLRDLGVTGVINLCDEYVGPSKLYQRYNIEHLILPTVDHFEPSTQTLATAIDFLRIRKSKGEKAFVHCKAGHGRSAAVALCWLISQHPGVSTQVLNQRLREKRSVRRTMYQQPCIKAFARNVTSTASAKR